MDLKAQIQQFFKGDVLDDEETLKTFSKDASIFIIKPKLVLAPRDAEDIKNLVKFINQHKDLNLSITPRSAGTCMSGGAINDSLILDMTKYFNKVISVSENSAITQPGVFYRDFEKETLAKNLLLPCYTSSRELNTVGGMIGNNSAGEKTLMYGQTERYVKSLKVVLSDGNEYKFYPLSQDELMKKYDQTDLEGYIYRRIAHIILENNSLIKSAEPQTSKNSSGYYLWKVWQNNLFDICKIITGSQGTLGIVTEIEFSLLKPKTHTAMLEIELQNLDKLDQIVAEVLKFHPESFECFDDQTLKFATRFLGDITKDFKKTPVYLRLFKLLPEILEKITNNFPKLVMIAEFTDDDPNIPMHQAKMAQNQIQSYNLKTRVVGPQDEEKYWIIRRDSFNILRHHSGDLVRTAPFIDDIVVNPSVLPQFLPKLQATLAPYADRITYTIAGHIGNGNFHIIPLMDFSKEEVRQVVPDLGKKIFDLVSQFKGSMAAEHNDGIFRGIYLPLMYGEEVYQLFKEVKEIFDPNNIFNPHKKTDATMEFATAHMDQGTKTKGIEDYAKSATPVTPETPLIAH